MYLCIFPELEIVGFIEIGDISSPPVMSRHLVLPIAVNKGSYSSDPLQILCYSLPLYFMTKCWFLLLCLLSEADEVGAGAADEMEEDTSTNQMAGKSPNFCVLLHGSLKVEGMVALVQLG